MFQIIKDKLPQFFVPAVNGYLFLIDQTEDYFIYFQFTGNPDRMIVEFELEYESTSMVVKYEHLNEIIYESLVILGDYNYITLRKNPNYHQLVNLFYTEVNENIYI